MIAFQVINYCISNIHFKNHTYSACETDRSVVLDVILISFFENMKTITLTLILTTTITREPRTENILQHIQLSVPGDGKYNPR